MFKKLCKIIITRVGAHSVRPYNGLQYICYQHKDLNFCNFKGTVVSCLTGIPANGAPTTYIYNFI